MPPALTAGSLLPEQLADQSTEPAAAALLPGARRHQPDPARCLDVVRIPVEALLPPLLRFLRLLQREVDLPEILIRWRERLLLLHRVLQHLDRTLHGVARLA